MIVNKTKVRLKKMLDEDILEEYHKGDPNGVLFRHIEFMNDVGTFVGYTFDDTNEFVDIRWESGYRYSYLPSQLIVVEE